MTPEQIDQMPAGPEFDLLIESEIFGSVPLTDDEWDLCKAMIEHRDPYMPLDNVRMLKMPLDEPSYQMKLMFCLIWPRWFTRESFGNQSQQVVEKMRKDGWLFESFDSSDGFRIVRFIHKESKGKYKGDGIAETDAHAICRAALKAKLALNKRGEK